MLRKAAGQPEVQDIVSLLGHDPITAAHVLRQVNSPVHSLRQQVGSIDRAATMLGFDSVANTVFIEEHVPKTAAIQSPRADLIRTYVVKVSVTASLIAHQLARAFDMERPDTIRTAGLLHLLGRMALLSEDADTYIPMWSDSETPAGRPNVVPPGIGREMVHFRTDFARHGEKIAKEWKYPSVLTESIRYHMDPERSNDTDGMTVRAVAVSQFAARSMFEREEHLGRDQADERIEQALGDLARTIGASAERVEQVVREAKADAYAATNGMEV